MQDEKRADLNELAERGRLVNQVIQHKGWTDVIRPSLESIKEQYLAEFRDASELSKFVVIQQSINSIDWLLNFIENTLATGKESLQELKREP